MTRHQRNAIRTPKPAPTGRAVALRPSAGDDPFHVAIPEAGLDVSFLFRQVRLGSAAARLQFLLRALCTMERDVSRAALHGPRIELQIDDARLVIGDCAAGLPGPARICRPDWPGARMQAARMAWYLDHHALALRLRLSTGAEQDLTSDLCALLVALHRPDAVVLQAQGLILTGHEFTQTPPTHLAGLRPGPALPHLRRTSPRPQAPEGRAPSPFARTPDRSPEAEIARAESIARQYCGRKQDDRLTSAFRDSARSRKAGRPRVLRIYAAAILLAMLIVTVPGAPWPL
ncbi:MAG: hypothetical protein EA386_13410 [Rhodobacteraceae bacterium]|nr:MAG: hypothetical protein EA386_13410 [Paracoccaceae bacterium]